MSKAYDSACYDLAKHFLGDVSHCDDAAKSLAQAIQDTVEDWMEFDFVDRQLERAAYGNPDEPVINRCLSIEGIGRVHAIGRPGHMSVGVMDHGDLTLGMLAADIVNGDAPGKILWAVRFQEKAA